MLRDYVRWFQDSRWHQVYPDGRIHGPNSNGYTIRTLVEYSRLLRVLSSCSGFESLRRGLSNPPQVNSTLFEVTVGAWLLSRQHSLELQIEPHLELSGHVKCPDFHWRNTLADCYVECKQTRLNESAEAKKLERARSTLVGVLAGREISPGLRLEVTLHLLLNSLEPTLRRAIEAASPRILAGDAGLLYEDHQVTVKLVERGPLQTSPGHLCSGIVAVGQTPVRLDDGSNMHLAVLMDVRKGRAKIVKRALKSARSQLPADKPSMIAVEAVTGQAVQDICESTLRETSKADTRMIQIWNGSASPAWVVYRNDQPLNLKALE